MKKFIVISIIGVIFFTSFTIAAEFNNRFDQFIITFNGNTLYVGGSGLGNYTTIQDAINAAPSNPDDYFLILIKKGTYNEKIFIENKNHLALVGEDRDSTVIVIALLRDDWLAEHPGDDWGSATVNIAKEVEDLVIANLTVKNNFAELYPDDSRKRNHSFAVRGGGNRVITVNANFISGGGDTFSLW